MQATMRRPKGKKYCTDESKLNRFLRGLKLRACPHCGRVGFLIGHGVVRGYADTGQGRRVRGRRFFCSNRFRRLGCGRTFSVVFAEVIVGFVVRTQTLLAYIEAVVRGLSRKAAWQQSAPCFSQTSGYRLWQRLQLAQTRLKAWLCLLRPPPACAATEPLAQLLAHLRSVFPLSACPLSSFQQRFQRPLFS